MYRKPGDAWRCAFCERHGVDHCKRCNLPLCGDHTPPATERCATCEKEYRPAVVRDHRTDWRIVGTTIALAVLTSLILLALVAADSVPTEALIALPIGAICCYPLGLMFQDIIHGAAVGARSARIRKRFMTERIMRRTDDDG